MLSSCKAWTVWAFPLWGVREKGWSQAARPGFASSSLGGSDPASAGALGLAQPGSAQLFGSSHSSGGRFPPRRLHEAGLALTGGRQN